MQDKQYKLIVFDIDGTILDGGKSVCQRLKNVVANLKQQGYLFTLATARIPLSALKIATDLGLSNPVICLNGSLIVDHKQQVLFSNVFDIAQVQSQLCQLPNIAINYYYEFDWVTINPSTYTDLEIAYLDIGDYNPYKPLNLDQVNKITLMGENDLLAAAKNKLSLDDSLIVAFSHRNYLELASKNINKLTGVTKYAQMYNLDLSQVIAFGDGENDIPMLAGVGLGVAMSNADEHVRIMAKDVTMSNFDQQGAALYLENLIKQGVL